MAATLDYSQLWAATQIPAAEGSIFVAATATPTGVVKNISAVICNTTGADATVEVWIIPAAGSTNDNNKLINAEVVPANSRFSFVVSDMTDGQTLVAKAGTASALTIHSTSGIVID